MVSWGTSRKGGMRFSADKLTGSWPGSEVVRAPVSVPPAVL